MHGFDVMAGHVDSMAYPVRGFGAVTGDQVAGESCCSESRR
jgi:hypothetical protein